MTQPLRSERTALRPVPGTSGLSRIGIVTAALLLLLAAAPAGAADDSGIARMVTCRDSWADWQKSGDARLKQLADHLRSAYAPHGNDAYLVPTSSVTVVGFRVLQLYPDSVGMGVGISVAVDAPFDTVRKSVDRMLGEPLRHCDTSDGMRTCELRLADTRTVTLMAGDGPKDTSTLLGCYYYYEK